MATRKGTDPVDGSSDSYEGSTEGTSRPTDHPDDPGYDMDDSRVHPLDGEPARTGTTAVPAATSTGKKTRSVGGNRHLTSLVLALVAVPVGYGFLDYAVFRLGSIVSKVDDLSQIPDRLLIMIGAAAGCFLLAGLASRISGMGALIAGVVWGVAPGVWVIVDYSSFVARLNDLPEFWDNTGFGIATYGIAVFPVVAGLLIGSGLGGKWRRPVPASRW